MKKIGRYDVVEELGRGAMGVVYKAFDPTIGRLVAIKVLSLGPTTQEGIPGAREIFMREARAAGRLAHPGIVTIHDALEDSETQTSYIVMELVPGTNLETILRSGPPMKAEQALEITRQVAEALDYAHRQQVIHRDLKPANILLTEDGRAKITDFGIAKIVAREGALRTATVMGTPSYMSPEQVIGGEVDGRSDLFSLGILLYVMLTGQKPFAGDTTTVMFKIVYEDPVPPSQVNPRLGPGHDYVATRCLVKDRSKRYASARELLDDLEDVHQGRNPRSGSQFRMAELRKGEPTLVSRRSPLARPAENWLASAIKRSTRIVVELVLLVGLIGLGVWTYAHRRPSPASSALVQTSAGGPASLRPAPPTTPAPAGSATPAPPTEVAAPRRKKEELPAKPATKPRHAREAVAKAVSTSTTSALSAPPPASTTVSPSPAQNLATASSRAARPHATSLTATGSDAELWCRHELKQGTLTVSSGSQSIFNVSLKGKKRRRFLGGGYTGTLSRPLKVPPGAQELSVRVVAADGSVDFSKTVPASPPGGYPATLQVVVTHDQLTLSWRERAHPTP